MIMGTILAWFPFIPQLQFSYRNLLYFVNSTSWRLLPRPRLVHYKNVPCLPLYVLFSVLTVIVAGEVDLIIVARGVFGVLVRLWQMKARHSTVWLAWHGLV